MNATLRRSRLILPLLTLVLAASVAAQDKVLTPDLILTVRQVTDAQLSPDGSRVIMQISRPRPADQRGAAVPELWIMPAAGGDPVRFTTGEEGDRAAQWSPDGGSIAFLSRRPGSEFTRVLGLGSEKRGYVASDPL